MKAIMSWFSGSQKRLWTRGVCAGLLCLLLAASPGCTEDLEQPEHGFLLPQTDAETASKEILFRDVDVLHERYGRDEDSLGSGSGRNPITPTNTVPPPSEPSYTPTVYIELYLKINPNEYRKKQIEENIEEGILTVLMDLLSSTNRVKRETGDTIVLELDSEKSTNDTTVLRVYIIDSESGDLNIEATAELYDAIVSNNQMFKTQIKRETDIDVLDEQFLRGPVAGDSLNGSSLKWWDILMITLGCIAAATCPILLVFAVSHLRMRIHPQRCHKTRAANVTHVRRMFSVSSYVKTVGTAMAGRICEAITFCCRWFTRRREDEEKEGLLTRDAQLDDTLPQPVRTSEPRVAAASGGLRERPSVNNNGDINGGGEWAAVERRDHVRRVARVGFQSRVQVQSHPLGTDEIETLLQNPATLRNEYSSIPSNLVTMADVPPGAEDKNRYKDILPNPQTRVSLFLKFAVANSDYINANFIRGLHDSDRVYIAAQGPLPWTVDDFWRMVWEQKTSTIVMVTGLEERRIVKCAQYWPDPQVTLTDTYGDLNVTLKKRETSNPNYTVSHFHVTHREKLVSREVTHFWFTAWPDHGVPASTEPALQFLSHVRSQTQDIPTAPIIVHCSAGIGRTGVFIGADVGMTQLEKEGEVDILKIVSTMRQDRGGMVQTEKQYIFLHQLLLSYARQLQPNASPSVKHRVPTTTFN